MPSSAERLKRHREYDRKWREANPEKRRIIYLRRYGMTIESFDELLEAQGGACAICQTTEPGGRGSWHIDHDHACCPESLKSCGDCVRGLLCQKCNMAIGLLNDDPTRLRAAVEYLERAELG